MNLVSMVSWNEILVKGVVRSYETRNLSKRFGFLIWETKEKASSEELSSGTNEERRSQRKQAIIKII